MSGHIPKDKQTAYNEHSTGKGRPWKSGIASGHLFVIILLYRPSFDLPQSNLGSPQNQTRRVWQALVTVATLHDSIVRHPALSLRSCAICDDRAQLSITAHAGLHYRCILSGSTSDLVRIQLLWTTRRQLGDLPSVLRRWMIYRLTVRVTLAVADVEV
jgi:hypothetical protein